MYNKRALLYRIPLLILSFFGLLYLIVHTPLRQYLPGYLDPNERALMEECNMRIDSIEQSSLLRERYLEHLIAVLSGNEGEALLPFDTVVVQLQDTLMAASERENAFVKRYEEQERFNLDHAGQDQVGRHPLFFAPLKGEVEMLGETESDRLGVDVKVSRETPVMAPLDGTVIAVKLVAGSGYDIIIQHAGDYLTVLSGLSLSLAEPQQKVKMGRVIGHAGGTSPSAGSVVNIQVWYKGMFLDPLTVMNFN